MIRLMGVLNVTPDSFSDGGRHADPIAAGMAMAEQGADIIDVGGESTRPGAGPVPQEEEQRRVLPVVAALAAAGLSVSVDTRNAGTMGAALNAGAAMINDVSALRHDPEARALLASRTCPVVLMHMRGTPQTMMQYARYGDIAAEVVAELAERVREAEAAGIARDRILIDPGLGFAKTAGQNIELLRRLPELAVLGLPILVGASRKAFVGHASGEPNPERRVFGSIAAALYAAAHGASILRVHDIAETRQALRMWQTLWPEKGKTLLF